MKKFTTIPILSMASAVLRHVTTIGNYSPRFINFGNNYLFNQREYKGVVYNFYKEKYAWYPGPAKIFNRPVVGLIVKAKNGNSKYMIMKMEEVDDKEYNCYVCYLPNSGKDYKEGNILEVPDWIKQKYKL